MNEPLVPNDLPLEAFNLRLERSLSRLCFLCCLTLLSLHAHATLKLATKRAPGPTKAYMGLRKI